MPSKIIAIQARSGSKRWPGKIYHKINGVSMLNRLYRTALETGIYTIVVGHFNDDKLGEYCKKEKINYTLSPHEEDDLIGRYAYLESSYYDCHVIRLTADCPFHMTSEIFWVANNEGYDFVSNAFPPRSTPDGVDCEMISSKLLHWMDENVKDPLDREHLPLYIYRNQAKLKRLGFTMKRLDWPVNLSHIKTSIDTKEDLARLRREGLIK